MSEEALYSTAAQVIPLLLLVLFIEDRARRAELSKREGHDLLAFLALLFFGELTAVIALTEDGSSLSESVVFLAIVAGFLKLALDPFDPLSGRGRGQVTQPHIYANDRVRAPGPPTGVAAW